MPAVDATHWAIVLALSGADFVMKDSEFPSFTGTWGSFPGRIAVERCSFTDVILLVPCDPLFLDCRLQLVDLRCDGNFSVQAASGSPVGGAFVRMERIVSPGWCEVTGYLAALDVIDCVFENGLYIRSDSGSLAKSCEVARSILWPRGDGSSSSSLWPSRQPLHLVSAFQTILVHGCELHGLLDDSFVSSVLFGAIVCIGAGTTVFERNKVLFGCTTDTSVDTYVPLLLGGREAICRDNNFLIDNDTGNDVSIARLVALRGESFAVGPVRARTSIVLRCDRNEIDFCPTDTGVHVAIIKNRLLQLELPTTDVGQRVLASCDQNLVQMTAATSCQWAETTVGDGVHVGGGSMHGNVHTDRVGHITSLVNGTNVACNSSSGALFTIADDVNF